MCSHNELTQGQLRSAVPGGVRPGPGTATRGRGGHGHPRGGRPSRPRPACETGLGLTGRGPARTGHGHPGEGGHGHPRGGRPPRPRPACGTGRGPARARPPGERTATRHPGAGRPPGPAQARREGGGRAPRRRPVNTGPAATGGKTRGFGKNVLEGLRGNQKTTPPNPKIAKNAIARYSDFYFDRGGRKTMIFQHPDECWSKHVCRNFFV